jgi:hypothetical protein
MADCGLNLTFTVENKITGDGWMRVEIPVGSMDSFKPESRFRRVRADCSNTDFADGFLKSSLVLPIILWHIVYFDIRFFINRTILLITKLIFNDKEQYPNGKEKRVVRQVSGTGARRKRFRQATRRRD